MDGNGRWAKKRGLARTNGHEKGINAVDEVTKYCIENNINNLTLYAFSTENWKRPKSEINFLMSLLMKFIKLKRENFIKNDIKFNTIGDLSPFCDELRKEISNLKEITKNNKSLNFNLAINYGGRDEIVRACKKIIKNSEDISEETINKNLDFTQCPDVDLLIRTGGEQRLSNFMLWQISYAELAFTNTLWPDFKQEELEKIVKNFKIKKRRFGGL